MEGTELTYDGLCGMVEGCLAPVSYDVFQQRRKLIVIAISEEVRFQKSVQKIEECNPNIKLIIVAQMELKKVLDGIYKGRYQVIGWSGKYTVELVDKIKSEADISGTDGFLYFDTLSVKRKVVIFIQLIPHCVTVDPNILFLL